MSVRRMIMNGRPVWQARVAVNGVRRSTIRLTYQEARDAHLALVSALQEQTGRRQRTPRLFRARSAGPQGTPCACCGARDRKLVRDHNHETGERRGVVCASCNVGIGFYEWVSQNPTASAAIRQYLDVFEGGCPLRKNLVAAGSGLWQQTRKPATVQA